MFRFLCVVLLAPLASAGSIDYEACGAANTPTGYNITLSIDAFEDGTQEVTLVKGKNYNLEIKFTSGSASETLENKLFGEIIGIPVPWDGVDADACVSLLPTEGCPLKAATNYIYRNNLTVAESYPSLSLTIIWKLVDANGENQVCFRLPATITN